MAEGHVFAGICGFSTDIQAHTGDDNLITFTINSGCPHIQKLQNMLKEVDPYMEIGFYGKKIPYLLSLQAEICPHAACPVFSGIVKTMEVEAGLALPKDVTMTFKK